MFDRDAVIAALISLALAVYVLVVTGGVSLAQDAPDGVLIDDIDVSEFPEVTVSITGPSSLAGITLSSDDVTVLEDGDARDVVITPVPTDDLEVILLVDTSGSMSGAPIAQAQNAAASFIDRMPPTTRIAVIGFGPNASLVTDFTTDGEAARTAVEVLAVSGETALYDAVADALGRFEPGSGAQRRLVIVSDGGDTASQVPIDIPLALLRSSDVQVQVISLVTPESDGPALRALASAGHGRVVEASDPEALATVFDTVASALVSQYELTFEAELGGQTVIDVGVDAWGHTSRDAEVVVLPIVTSEAASAPASVTDASTAPIEPAPAPAVAAAPVVRTVADDVGSWLYPVGLALAFAGLAGLFWFAFRPRRRQNVLTTLGPSVDSTRAFRGWLRGTPGFLSKMVSGALSRRGREGRLEMELARAGVELRPTEMVLLSAVVVIVAALIGLLFGGVLLAVILGLVAYLVIRAVLRTMGHRRQKAFAGQLHGVLTLMAGSLRSGYSVTQAIDAVAREADAPASVEFNRALVEVQLGRDLTEAFDAVADRVDNEDFRWVVEAIEISRSVGGDLGDVLDNVAKTIRDRERVARHVRTLSAEGRLSAWILSALPLVMVGYLALVSPEYLENLTETGAGQVLMVVTATVVGIGVVWMRRIVRPEF